MEHLKGEVRKQQIVTVASRICTELGPDQLSVRKVAEASGIGMGTLRHHFPTQKDLHQAVILRMVNDEIHDHDIGDTSQDPAPRLSRCLLQFLPTEEEQTPLLTTWFGLYRVGLDPHGSPFAKEFLEVSTRRARQRVREWLTQLAGEGHLREADLDDHTQRLLVTVNGSCLELLTPGTELTLDAAHRLVTSSVQALFHRAGNHG